MLDQLDVFARRAAPAVTAWSVRGVVERSEDLNVRQGVAQAPSRRHDRGVMVSVSDRGAQGFAATADVSEPGMKAAFGRARDLAHAAAGRCLFDAGQLAPQGRSGRYASRSERPVATTALRERLDLLQSVNASIRIDDRIVDWTTSLWTLDIEQRFISSGGADTWQQWQIVVPNILATAHSHGVTQTRSAAGQYNGFCQQGGLEVLDRARFVDDGPRVAREAIELTMAPQCPSGRMELLLMPDQMMLQIHESIGHPLELDRILGDERNFAGTSFVTLEMFGGYRYGSELLNVSHDPQRAEQLASFAFDDDGTPAERRMLIENGILQRPLGGSLSQARAAAAGTPLEGVATSRACSWNRAPIDRMSNLNIEAGETSLDEMVGSIEFGVMMKTNQSWSIDDSRNKFQFGCEYGRVIRNGRLAEVVRNPNYRGVSATFWRSLVMVGDAETFEVMGTPFCGKGEPSQVIRVGHASPACKFTDVAVFGGE
ncbi:TldD/PmbA family protein [Piscinibacter sakaiensis]|uniref:TldD/PmbA family protein n=1 Tax=Piscinibacter sakaiensis TaxID=1547922 RepID=UPI003AADBA3A